MRYIYWLILILCFVPLAEAEPYTARITADGVAVRSGPGIEFYPVLQLQTGDKVEVHYEQGEWYAIRPPIGSFSWVSAKYVDFGSSNVGTVLADGLASRIGSCDSDDCDTVQIALKKGESVLILERRETPENHASPVWLKIAPPSGEFRWIHRSALQLNIRQVRHDVMEAEIPELPKVAQPERSIPVPKLAMVQPVATTRESTSPPTVIDPFQRAFNELQREAYVVMTRPTDDEVFALLIQRAEELHQIAPTDLDLEKTYHLLESLQRTRSVRRELALRRPTVAAVTSGANQSFASLFSRSPAAGAAATAAAGTGTAATGTAATATTAGAPVPQRQSVVPAYTPTAAQSDSLRAGVNIGGYDIVGRLGIFDPPLPKDHPPYAVVDERGQIICLITPSANLDLSPHIGQFVGINGVLGYDNQLGRARHITARSVRTLR